MKCPVKSCGVELSTPAEAFLHEQLHAEPWEGDLNGMNLWGLPYSLMPRVARLMEDYHASRLAAGAPGGQ